MAKYMKIHTYHFTADVAVSIWDHDRDLFYRIEKVTEASIKRLNKVIGDSDRYYITARLHYGEWFDGRTSTTVTTTVRRK